MPEITYIHLNVSKDCKPETKAALIKMCELAAKQFLETETNMHDEKYGTDGEFSYPTRPIGREPNHWILMGNPDDGEVLMFECLPENFTCWTTHKEAKIGDVVYFYITAPISGIVAKGVVNSEPELNDIANHRWAGYYFSDISELTPVKEFPIAISQIRRLFPDWAYWRYPRRNTRIPDEFVTAFNALIEGGK